MRVLVRLDAVKPSVIRAAQDLGGTSLTVIRRVLFPAASPALVSGFLLVFALATASYAIPAVLGGGRVVTIAEVIYTNQAVTFNWPRASRSEEHTSELQSLMRISYAVFCLKK